MKRDLIIICVLLALFSLLTGCGNDPEKKPENAKIINIFEVDGISYAVRSGEHLFLEKETEEGSKFIKLTGQNDRATGNAVWHENSGRIYYTRNHKIYSCDLNGENKKLIWKLPGGGWKDYLTISAATDDYLLLESAYKKVDYSYLTRDMYSLDLSTGTATPIMQKITHNKVPMVLSTYGNTVAVIQTTEARSKARIMTFDLENIEVKEILRMDSSSGFDNAYGALCGDTLYFISGRAAMYAVSLSDGTVVPVQPDTSLVPELSVYYSIQKCGDKVYFLIANRDNSSTALCEYDTARNLLIPVVTTGEEMKARNFHICGDTYYLYYGSRFISGTFTE